LTLTQTLVLNAKKKITVPEININTNQSPAFIDKVFSFFFMAKVKNWISFRSIHREPQKSLIQ